MQGVKLGQQLAWCVCLDQGLSFDAARSTVKDFFSGSRAIMLPEQKSWIEDLPSMASCIHNHSVLPKIESQFLDWIRDHRYNEITGLESFEADISQGATQAFDSFLLRHHDRRVVFMSGEYFYHVVSCNSANRSFSYITDVQEIRSNDCMIISVPFCDTGSPHPKLHEILERCDQLEVPVLLDCAYWTLSRDIKLDVDRPCVDTVAFSLSKTWPVAHARVGMRYTRSHVRDGQKLHRNIGYNNRLSAAVGLHVMRHYRADYLVDQHWSNYIKLTDALGLAAGNSVIFADGDHTWQQYSRRSLLDMYGLDLPDSGFRRRICLTRLLEAWPLVETILDEYHSQI